MKTENGKQYTVFFENYKYENEFLEIVIGWGDVDVF